uniref:Uncharacterized protein n=1 Tax=Cyprinus carpio TaxID=7962 RepID=A0A8C1XUU8_CYPCA
QSTWRNVCLLFRYIMSWSIPGSWRIPISFTQLIMATTLASLAWSRGNLCPMILTSEYRFLSEVLTWNQEQGKINFYLKCTICTI